MKKNFPVSQNEYPMQDDKPIVSKTDLKGKITYANPYFIEMSGFEESELIGAPHNIIRHPDMPAEAFADMWRTLKCGLPWSAVVKNRRKNGDYYWVVANATALMEHGKIVGYLSVRTKPSRAQIVQAENLYRAMREGTANVVLHYGQLIRKGLPGWIDRWRQISLPKTIVALEGISVFLFLMIAAVALTMRSGGGMSAVIAGTGVLWALLSGYVLHHTLSEPLAIADAAARAMAGGDLSVEIDDSCGGQMRQLLHALRQTSINLRSIIGDLRTNIETMNVATSEIAAGNMDLSSRTEAQASNLEQTASSMEELSSTVKQNSESAEEAHRLVRESSTLALGGSDVVTRVGSTMAEITSSATKIRDITSMIDSIAFQTNILALNAAVEAARAGEDGRGFAVVAGEVRNLAQRSASAAKDIKGLIDISVATIDNGNTLVDEAQVSIKAIVDSVRRVEAFVSDIAVASNEQSRGIEQVNEAVMQMEDFTQQNAAMVEEAAAAAERLNEQAGQVAQTISLFRTGQQMQVLPNLIDADTGYAIPVLQSVKPVGSTVKRLPAGTRKRLALAS